MALSKNAAGYWTDAEGLYPVQLKHARKGEDGLFRFHFTRHPLGTPEIVESDTDWAYLPDAEAGLFMLRGWGRLMNDDEAARINGSALVEDGASEEDRRAAAELEAEERAKAERPAEKTEPVKPAKGR